MEGVGPIEVRGTLDLVLSESREVSEDDLTRDCAREFAFGVVGTGGAGLLGFMSTMLGVFSVVLLICSGNSWFGVFPFSSFTTGGITLEPKVFLSDTSKCLPSSSSELSDAISKAVLAASSGISGLCSLLTEHGIDG